MPSIFLVIAICGGVIFLCLLAIIMISIFKRKGSGQLGSIEAPYKIPLIIIGISFLVILISVAITTITALINTITYHPARIHIIR